MGLSLFFVPLFYRVVPICPNREQPVNCGLGMELGGSGAPPPQARWGIRYPHEGREPPRFFPGLLLFAADAILLFLWSICFGHPSGGPSGQALSGARFNTTRFLSLRSPSSAAPPLGVWFIMGDLDALFAVASKEPVVASPPAGMVKASQ